MAKCPVCEHDVAAPFFLNVDGWRWLACPHCAARLERKNPRILVPLMGFWFALLPLGRLGHRFATLAEVLMVAIFVVILLQSMRPDLQPRKHPRQPEIHLNLTRPAD